MNKEDQVLFQFPVLWSGWGADDTAWIMERADGSRYIKMTDHGKEYESTQAELINKIKEYEGAVRNIQLALSFLK